MDQDMKIKWLDSLRSGDYQQGREHLYRDGKYCCIGVLISCVHEKVGTEVYRVGYQRVEPIIGINNADTLVEMNDGRGKFINNPQTFEQIAAYIEANL